MDSDFSIDENDELVSDNDDDKPKRRKQLTTKAYKEPKVSKKEKPKEIKPKFEKIKKRNKIQKATFTVRDSGRKSFRKSTALKSAATQEILKARHEAEKKKVKTIKADEWIPTQAELLEEAVITEKENMLSLGKSSVPTFFFVSKKFKNIFLFVEKFKKLELEKKKTRPTKRVYTGAIVRYHSMTMPCIANEKDEKLMKMEIGENLDK